VGMCGILKKAKKQKREFSKELKEWKIANSHFCNFYNTFFRKVFKNQSELIVINDYLTIASGSPKIKLKKNKIKNLTKLLSH
jgi:hypothetical protein